MGFWNRLLGGRTPGPPPRDVAALAEPLARPALQLTAGLPVRSGAPTPSWFLGEPDLPPGVAHPERNGRPLSHLATIDLAAVQSVQPLKWLPASGSLAFFYDVSEMPFGAPEDRGAWAVRHRTGRATSRSPDSRPISFRSLKTYPPPERDEALALGLTDEEWDLYCGLEQAQTGVEYCHQVGGYQSLIQGDGIEEQCEFAINGLRHSPKTARSDRGRTLSAQAKDWRLLLQVASDQNLGFTWGDGGNLHFMIRERDARAGRFDDVWLIGECF
jgi:uncharacterized protein YwqG